MTFRVVTFREVIVFVFRRVVRVSLPRSGEDASRAPQHRMRGLLRNTPGEAFLGYTASWCAPPETLSVRHPRSSVPRTPCLALASLGFTRLLSNAASNPGEVTLSSPLLLRMSFPGDPWLERS